MKSPDIATRIAGVRTRPHRGRTDQRRVIANWRSLGEEETLLCTRRGNRPPLTRPRRGRTIIPPRGVPPYRNPQRGCTNASASRTYRPAKGWADPSPGLRPHRGRPNPGEEEKLFCTRRGNPPLYPKRKNSFVPEEETARLSPDPVGVAAKPTAQSPTRAQGREQCRLHDRRNWFHLQPAPDDRRPNN